MKFDYEDHERMLRFWAMVALALGCLAVALFLNGCSILGETKTKITPIPAAPVRTAENQENAKKVAGAITDSARKAHEQGMVPKSTASGTLVDLAIVNETFVGSPDKRVSPDDMKAIAALVGAMQRQEEQYRADRAAWEAKIDAMSRERDQYKTEVTTMGGIIAKMKFWLWLGVIGLAVACVLFPGFLWFLVRFISGRAKAHLTTTVEAIQEFREKNRKVAPKLDTLLDKYQDKKTKAQIIDIKNALKKAKVA